MLSFGEPKGVHIYRADDDNKNGGKTGKRMWIMRMWKIRIMRCKSSNTNKLQLCIWKKKQTIASSTNLLGDGAKNKKTIYKVGRWRHHRAGPKEGLMIGFTWTGYFWYHFEKTASGDIFLRFAAKEGRPQTIVAQASSPVLTRTSILHKRIDVIDGDARASKVCPLSWAVNLQKKTTSEEGRPWYFHPTNINILILIFNINILST